MTEMPKAFSTKTRKANKLHTCCECNHVINTGEEYQYSSGVWDEPRSFKQCLDCHQIMLGASAHDKYNEGVPLGDLREYCFGFMSSSYKGREFVRGMAKDFGVRFDQMNKLLNII